MPRSRHGNYDLLSSFQHYTPGVGGALALLLWFVVGALLGSAVTIIYSVFASPQAVALYGTLIAYPVMFIPPAMYAAFKSRRNATFDTGYALDSAHFIPVGGWLLAVISVVATLALSFACDAVNILMPPMPEWLENALNSMTTDGKLWVNLLCVSVMAPLCEEWLCRGMILRGLLNHRRPDGSTMSPAAAIILSALLFGLIHANPWQAIPAFAIGCLMGYVYYRTGSLRLTMLMHCANNTFALLMSRIPALEGADNFREVLPERMYWVILAACVLLIILSVRAVKRVPLSTPRGGCDEISADLIA